MDSQMAMMYRRNRIGVLALLDAVLDEGFGRVGGLFYLTHDAYFSGISGETVRRLELPSLPAITDTEQREPAWYEGLAPWAAKFGTDAVDFIDGFFQRGQGLFIRADETLKENPLLGLVLWADALALGIPSALWEGLEHRWDMVKEDPSLDTVLNFLTLGLGELIDGAITPEEPWSFQHFMDMLGVLTVIYGAVKGIQGALGGDDAAGIVDDVAGTLDDAAIRVGDKLVFGSDTKSITKLVSQMRQRGWTETAVRDVVDKPYTTRISQNLATGNPATVFYNQAGGYVIVDDITNAIVQISDNRNPALWIPDSNIINPYRP